MNANDLPEANPAMQGSIVRRPVVPMRPIEPKASRNPFTLLEEALQESKVLQERLEALTGKLAGTPPPFKSSLSEAPNPDGGLLLVAGGVATILTERARHGVSLVDKIEEYLG